MTIKKWSIITIVVSSILGTLLHFTYNWFNQNVFVGIFSAINESSWEHLKIAFFPLFLMAIIGYFVIGKNFKNYWFAKASGIIITLAWIIVSFYTYSGVLGYNISVINIILFFIGIILGEYVAYRLLKSENNFSAEKAAIVILIALVFSFILYTFYPPKIGIFKDPIDNSYGINNA